MPGNPWISEVDPTSGKTFYVNESTGETTWQVPFGFGTSSATTTASAAPAAAAAASPWISEVDPASGDTFYVNESTGVTTWQKPVDFTSPAAAASPWISEVDPNTGDTFYVNESTGVTQWEEPPDFWGTNLDDLRRPKSGGGPKKPLSSKWKRAFAKVRVMVALNSKYNKPSWEKHFDDETGEFFYHNTVTGNSTWDEPESFIRSLPAPKSPSAQARAKFFQDEEGKDNEGASSKRPGSRGSTTSSRSRRPGSRGSTGSKRPDSRGSTSSKRPGSRGSTSGQRGTRDNRDQDASKKSVGKKTPKNELDIDPIIAAIKQNDLEKMLAAMDKSVAKAARHRGRSLFSGARDVGGKDEGTLEEEERKEKEEEEKKKKDKAKWKKRRHPDDEATDEDEKEANEEPRIVSEKAKNVYRVQEYKRKRYEPIINQVNAKGLGALHVACENGNEQVLRTLIELGADLNIRDKSLNTPLHIAVQKGHLRCVYILLRDGADPSLRTRWGQSAYDVAKYKNYMKICRLFENGEKEFDIVQLFVDRKWYKVDVHLVRHGKTTNVPIDDTMFYIKTKYRTKAHTHHPDLH